MSANVNLLYVWELSPQVSDRTPSRTSALEHTGSKTVCGVVGWCPTTTPMCLDAGSEHVYSFASGVVLVISIIYRLTLTLSLSSAQVSDRAPSRTYRARARGFENGARRGRVVSYDHPYVPRCGVRALVLACIGGRTRHTHTYGRSASPSGPDRRSAFATRKLRLKREKTIIERRHRKDD